MDGGCRSVVGSFLIVIRRRRKVSSHFSCSADALFGSVKIYFTHAPSERSKSVAFCSVPPTHSGLYWPFSAQKSKKFARGPIQ